MSKEVIIIGASGHGKVIADIVNRSGDKVFGFLDDDTLKQGVIGKVADCVKYRDKWFIIGIGNNKIRRKIANYYPDLNYCTAIHPSAVIADNVKIGKGTAVMANAVINPCAVIGEHCIINTGAIVEHDNTLGSFVHISPGAVLCGTVTVGDNSHIGAGAVVRNNIHITNDVVVGCGGCVIKDIVKPEIYAGVPVKEIEAVR